MADKPTPEKSERSGRGKPRSIGELARPLMAQSLGKRGFAAASLAADWATIVGPALANATLPLKVVFPRGERADATLHLRVASGAMALQLQHLGPLIVERVNTHFGYKAVSRLSFVQGPVPQNARKAAAKPAEIAAQTEVDADLARTIAALPEGELRTALADLGRRLAAGWQRP